MDGIAFKAAFGDEQRNVELTNVAGAHGKHVHLYVNRYYWGAFHLTAQGEWRYSGDSLETPEIDILLDMVIEKWGYDNEGI
jgi:hypothetical protein